MILLILIEKVNDTEAIKLPCRFFTLYRYSMQRER